MPKQRDAVAYLDTSAFTFAFNNNCPDDNPIESPQKQVRTKSIYLLVATEMGLPNFYLQSLFYKTSQYPKES